MSDIKLNINGKQHGKCPQCGSSLSSQQNSLSKPVCVGAKIPPQLKQDFKEAIVRSNLGNVNRAIQFLIKQFVEQHRIREKEKVYTCANCNTKFRGRLAKCPKCDCEFDWDRGAEL